MPFPDEIHSGVSVVDYRDEWPAEFDLIAGRLRSALGDRALAVDHVGSTSVPGLPAKNCIDVQVRTEALEEAELRADQGACDRRSDGGCRAMGQRVRVVHALAGSADPVTETLAALSSAVSVSGVLLGGL
ncbi:MAG TPA: GrpB family protein [Kribbella sp.]